MQVHDLRSPKGSRKKKRIVGRGNGSGRGKTSGRGHTGQNARTGRGIIKSSEGGQISLIRRLPKVGFRSHRPKVYQLVQLDSLSQFKDGAVVDARALRAKGLIKSMFKPYKVLGDGEVKKALTVQAYSFSKSASEKITKAGGKAETIDQQVLKKAEKASNDKETKKQTKE